MLIEEIIQGLKNSNLIAESPCGCEFELSKAILFDGTKPFPKEALETRQSYLNKLKGRDEELKKQKKLTTEKAVITTRSVNIGKNLEKVFPTLKAFPWDLADSRFIGDPIDMITTIDNPMLNKVREQVKGCIQKEKYEWKIARIGGGRIRRVGRDFIGEFE